MPIDRRRCVALALAAPILLRTTAAWAQAAADSTALLQRALDEAAPLGRSVVLPAGTSLTRTLRLPPGTHLVGAGRGARLVAVGDGPILAIGAGAGATVEGISIEGGGPMAGRAVRPGALPETGLIEAVDAADVRLIDCRITGAPGRAVRLQRCGGRIAGTHLEGARDSAIFALDSRGLSIVDNSINRCGDNGIQIWRSTPGDDGTILRGNRIGEIGAARGGDGPYGNGISVFRAGGVICEGNVIRDCAFSAVRFNSASNALIANNQCARLREVALYVEFAWQGAVVQGNIVEDAALGISITNMDHGGRLAACHGNVLRNIRRVRPQGDNGNGASIRGIGVHVEADTAVTGNVVEGADEIGILLGWGIGLRDVVASGNLTRDCPIGIGVSIAPGAGSAFVANNLIVNAKRAAIAGMAWDKVASPDLVRDASRHLHLTLKDNLQR